MGQTSVERRPKGATDGGGAGTSRSLRQGWPPAGTTNGAKSSQGSDETWIGRGEENAAYVCLQGMLGRVACAFHSGDTKTLERLVPNFASIGTAIRTALASGSADPLKAAPRKEKRLGGRGAQGGNRKADASVPAGADSGAGGDGERTVCNAGWSYIQ